MKLILEAAAQADIAQARDWYRQKSRRLEARFLDAVRAAGGQIREHPEAYPVIHRDVRRVRLKRFPYSLLYRIYPDALVVVACFHGRRDPLTWKSRLDG